MEAFPVGSHVVIELADERKIAGHIVDGNVQEGVLLSVTHKDTERIFKIGDSLAHAIADRIKTRKTIALRGAMLVRGHLRGVMSVRDEMEAQLQFDEEADILDRQEDGYDFKEMATPVLTFVNPGAIMLMEKSTDVLREADASNFDATLDDTLEEILTVGEGEETKEEDVESDEGSESTGTVGREGSTEA